ncbi:hypothetical protein CC79DRAFT_1329200 [Sarocladium strictum]
MRRAASCASTGPAPATKLKHSLVKNYSYSQLLRTPSALVYTSLSPLSVQGQAFSARAGPKLSSWPAQRDESSWRATSATFNRNDAKLGQEGGGGGRNEYVPSIDSSTRTKPRVLGQGQKLATAARPARTHGDMESSHLHHPVTNDPSRKISASLTMRHPLASVASPERMFQTSDASNQSSVPKSATTDSIHRDSPVASSHPPPQDGLQKGFSSRRYGRTACHNPSTPPVSVPKSTSTQRIRLRDKSTHDLSTTGCSDHDTLRLKPQGNSTRGSVLDSSPKPASEQHNRPGGLIAELREKTLKGRCGSPTIGTIRPDGARLTNTLPEQTLQDRSAVSEEAPYFHDSHGMSTETAQWLRLAMQKQRESGGEAAWAAMAPLADDGCVILTLPDADELRTAFLVAAIDDDVRIHHFVQVATRLRRDYDFEWPDLYGNVLYRLLDEPEPSRALFWHSRLYSLFAPTQAVFASLLSHFVVDSSPMMQSTLAKMYESSKGARLYDTIIARLFDWGQSFVARKWRKRLIACDDHPYSEASAPFLRFLSLYYPLLELTESERAILDSQENRSPLARTRSETELEEIKRSIHGDHIVAKWFASAWTTVDFAIELVHRFGVIVLGPLALQSLGLRDPGAKNLAEHISKLESLGVSIAPMTYSQVVAQFAKHGKDALLESLLTCDVHPDEFEDMETVRMLAGSTGGRQSKAVHHLMREVEATIEAIRVQDQHDHAPARNGLGTFRSALTPLQSETAETLDLTFHRLGYHPQKWLASGQRRGAESTRLDQAVIDLRRAVVDDVPIPRDYWKRLVYNYGRLGLMESLETVCLELVEIYSASNARRIPVHPSDIPKTRSGAKTKIKNASDGLELWQHALEGRAVGSHEIGYIPSDLPFSHREHPVQKIFHQKLQRSILRWGFDNALQIRHQLNGSLLRDRGNEIPISRAAHLSDHGVAQGLRILALLRDAGVLIDTQIIQSEVVRRLVAADLPGRDKAAWMDHHELATPNIMRLVDETWGPGIFTDAEDLQHVIQTRQDKIREHYWKNRRP